MALPRKGRRTITVDGIKYHWIAFMQDNGFFRLSFTVMQADAEGQQLICRAADRVVYPVTPFIVRQAIQYARNLGWTPDQPGGQFEITEIEKQADLHHNR